jgi:hypothetical protein
MGWGTRARVDLERVFRGRLPSLLDRARGVDYSRVAMGRGGKLVIGAVLLLGGVALFELSVFHLVQVGTCASGGPYEIRNPCPHSTWAWLGLILPALISGLIGAAVLDVIGAAWVGGWILSGIVSIVAVYSHGAHAGSKTGGIIAAVVWIGLGLFFALFFLGSGKAKPSTPTGPPPG